VLRFDRRYHAWWQRTTADRRWTQYYDAILTHKEAAGELRLFGLSGYFSSAYQRLRSRLRAERLTEMRKQSVAKLAAASITLLISGAAVLWMVLRTHGGVVSLGDLVLLYQVFSRGQAHMRSVLANLGQILTSNLYLTNLFDFLGLTPGIADPPRPVPVPVPLQRGIRLKDVTFRYPGSQTDVLENVNLFIPANRIVAIVGPNGAGKTTILKLLCRFYDTSAGSVELDGVNVRDVALDDLRRATTVLFQLPVPYHATAGESIALGDLGSRPTADDIEHAARSAGAHDMISRLPQGYDTLLGKWYANGVELSVGQQQRVALARAYLRQAPIILLDEPTSFIDSWAEADWFEQFRLLALDRTAVIITHRFTIAKRADLIHVMEDGRIVESGTHQDLVQRSGLYARSWEAQTREVVSDQRSPAASRAEPTVRRA
jgi:ATP-binding cassette subfamily B protein